MNVVTIPRECGNDPHYRYKREKIQVKHLGKKGGQTVIENMDNVMKSIEAPAEKMRKILQRNLHCSVSKNFVVTGIFSADHIDDIIEGFILHKILCPVCKNPETSCGKYCRSCGWSK